MQVYLFETVMLKWTLHYFLLLYIISKSEIWIHMINFIIRKWSVKHCPKLSQHMCFNANNYTRISTTSHFTTVLTLAQKMIDVNQQKSRASWTSLKPVHISSRARYLSCHPRISNQYRGRNKDVQLSIWDRKDIGPYPFHHHHRKHSIAWVCGRVLCWLQVGKAVS